MAHVGPSAGSPSTPEGSYLWSSPGRKVLMMVAPGENLCALWYKGSRNRPFLRELGIPKCSHWITEVSCLWFKHLLLWSVKIYWHALYILLLACELNYLLQLLRFSHCCTHLNKALLKFILYIVDFCSSQRLEMEFQICFRSSEWHLQAVRENIGLLFSPWWSSTCILQQPALRFVLWHRPDMCWNVFWHRSKQQRNVGKGKIMSFIENTEVVLMHVNNFSLNFRLVLSLR